MTDLSNTLKLPISPYLENSTLWWVDTFCLPVDATRTKEQQAEMLQMYHQWMSDQGVVVKSHDYVYTVDDPCLDFVDEQSMLLFILKWGN